jgi:hypothetical protein
MAEAAWLWTLWMVLLAPPEPIGAALDQAGAEIVTGAEIDRLHGHRVVMTAAGYAIEDIAGEGRPVVGVVERRGPHLVVVTAEREVYRLAGILARPRFAGPGYKIWALGQVSERSDGERVLTPRRMGVLASPARRTRDAPAQAP